MNNEQNHILTLSMKRDEFLQMYENSYDESVGEYGDYTIEEPTEIDVLGEDILKCLINWEDKLSFEFIFEQITKLGYAPNLIYDDNGNFAISSGGSSSIHLDASEEYDAVEIVYKDKWHTSVREALKQYLNDLK